MARRSSGVVEIEPANEPETVPQRAGHESGPGRGPHQGEAGQVETDRAGRRAFADQDVEPAVLHGRIEHLFDRAVQPVDLVDEQHITVLEVGQQRGEVAGSREHRAGRDAETGAHLGRDDPREGRLAETRRACKEEVVDGLMALAGRLQHDAEMLDELGLADEFGQRPRPQPDFLEFFFGRRGRRVDDPRCGVVVDITRSARLDAGIVLGRDGKDLPASLRAHRDASSRNARRSISSTPTSSRRPSSAARISSGP